MAWQIFGRNAFKQGGGVVVLNALSSASLRVETQKLTQAKVEGVVSFRISVPTTLNLTYNITLNGKSITDGEKALLQNIEIDNASSTNTAEANFGFTLTEKHIKECKKEQVFVLTVTNNSTTPITIDYWTFVILGPRGPRVNARVSARAVGLNVLANQIDTPSNQVAQTIPPNDHRNFDVFVRTVGGTVKVDLAMSIANFSGQTFQPILLVNVFRGKKSLTKGNQDLIRIPTIVTPSPGFNRIGPVSLTLVDKNCPPGCHTYKVMLINQSVKTNQIPTFIEVDVIDVNVTFPHCAINHLTTVQILPPLGMTALTLAPFSSYYFSLKVPTSAETVKIDSMINPQIPPNTIMILEYDFLVGGESIRNFNGLQRISDNRAGTTTTAVVNFPFTFVAHPNPQRCKRSNCEELVYQFNLVNMSQDPSGNGVPISLAYYSIQALSVTVERFTFLEKMITMCLP